MGEMFTSLQSECFFDYQQVGYSSLKMIFTFIYLHTKLNIMSLKYSSTTADYLQWSEAMNLVRKLARDSNYKMSLLIALGCFTGLRISDILALRWNQILDAEEFTITEIKTGKQRTIRINMQLQQHIRDCYDHINPVGINAPVLISQKGTVYTVQRINVMLKEIKKKYKLHGLPKISVWTRIAT